MNKGEGTKMINHTDSPFEFGGGYCREFAVALNEAFGCPMEAMREHSFRTGEVLGIIHAYCVVDPITIVDFTGIASLDAVMQHYDASHWDGVFSRTFASRQFMNHPWREAAPLNNDAIRAAHEYIIEHSDLFDGGMVKYGFKRTFPAKSRL
jgi:hypothetical protein